MKVLMLAAAICVAGMLSGCGAVRMSKMRETSSIVQSDIAGCRAGKFGTYVDRAKCMNLAEAPMRQFQSSPDLFDVRASARIALSEKVDRKQMTPAEAQYEFAKLNSGLVGTEGSRLNASRSVAAQERAASSDITCNRFGSTVSCY